MIQKLFVLKLFTVAVMANLITGCATTDKSVSFSYPIDDKLDVMVKFECKKAVDATQLGMLLLNKAEGVEPSVRVDSPGFFPEYFAMVNVNIEDGLLYISNREAKNFVQVVYKNYQKKSESTDFMRKHRDRRTIETVDNLKIEE